MAEVAPNKRLVSDSPVSCRHSRNRTYRFAQTRQRDEMARTGKRSIARCGVEDNSGAGTLLGN